jgi:hypothetical protein
MVLRQNDFGTISKPIALRAGATLAFEVVVVRRDGFNGEIELGMEGLPPGVTASGVNIPAGQMQGMMVISANENARRAFSVAKMFGRARINGASVTRPCRLASVEWPVEYAPSEFPTSRLVADAPVSVTDAEQAPVTLAPNENKLWEAKVGETMKIPLKVTWRNEFNGTSIKFKAYGSIFGGVKEIDVPIKAANSEAVIDLAALKTPPGEYTLAFRGIGITRYSYNPDAVKIAEEAQKKSGQEVAALTAAAKKLAAEAAAAPADRKTEAANLAKIAAGKQKQAETELAEATSRMKKAATAAAPKDILDIIATEPIRISVKAATATTAAVTTKP